MTICTKNRENFFGEIREREMFLSPIGEIAEKFWRAIPAHFPNAKLDEFVVMPNNLHGILVIENANSCCKNAINRVSTTMNISATTNNNQISENKTGGITGSSNPMGKNSLGEIIRWFKGRSSFEIHKIHPALDRIWQARFHDRVIRDEDELNNIREYIWQNPENWARDEENFKK